MAGAALILHCGRNATLPSPPTDVSALAVLPTDNRTGKTLLVSGEALLDRLVSRRPVTVGDWIASHARFLLRKRGFQVRHDGRPDVPTLRFEIQRWDAQGYDTSAVTVSVAARLTNPQGDEILWEVSRFDWRISTLGAPTVSDARLRAARSIAGALLSSWRASSPD